MRHQHAISHIQPMRLTFENRTLQFYWNLSDKCLRQWRIYLLLTSQNIMGVFYLHQLSHKYSMWERIARNNAEIPSPMISGITASRHCLRKHGFKWPSDASSVNMVKTGLAISNVFLCTNMLTTAPGKERINVHAWTYLVCEALALEGGGGEGIVAKYEVDFE